MTEKRYSTDVVIIGAGPIGLFAIFQLGMLKIKCHVIESLEEVGGQCRALYPEKPIYDIPAYPSISANQLIDKLEEQAKPFNATFHLNQQASKVDKTAEGFNVTTSQGAEISCKAVIVAAGAGAFGPNRPPLEGLEQYEGRSVFYMIKRRQDFAGKKIVIAGGGDSAVDWAISLSEIAEKIYFIHRRDKFRAAPESIEQLYKIAESGKLEIMVPYQLRELKGNNGQLREVVIEDLEGKSKTLEADVLLPLFGITPQLGAIAEWGLDIDNGRIKTNSTTAETNIKGIFAIGDISTYENKIKLILCGFGEAAQAAHNIHNIVFPNDALHFVYSTTKGVKS